MKSNGGVSNAQKLHNRKLHNPAIEMGSFMKLGRCILIFVNFLFLTVGSLLIGIASWILFTSNYTNEPVLYFLHNVSFIPKVLLLLGTIVIGIAFVGLLGACRENAWMLRIYGWILLFILIFKIWVAVFVLISSYTKHNHVPKTSQLENMFGQYGLNKGDTLLVDTVQLTFKCCGYKYPQDIRFANETYPPTCCGYKQGHCIRAVYSTGCTYKIKEIMSPIMVKMMIVYYTIVGIQILCIAIAFRLNAFIRRKIATDSLYYSFS